MPGPECVIAATGLRSRRANCACDDLFFRVWRVFASVGPGSRRSLCKTSRSAETGYGVGNMGSQFALEQMPCCSSAKSDDRGEWAGQIRPLIA
jgi:hypothetical protein